MSALSGPKLEQIKKLAAEWYVTRRQALIEALEEDYPYGTVKLSPTEQYMRFQQMQPQDWMDMLYQLQDRYRGQPNSYLLVNKDLQAYVNQMLALSSQIPSQGEPNE